MSNASMSSASPSTVGVVTVTFSPGETLTDWLDSVTAATHREVRVVLADNGSTDGSVEAAAERDGVTLLRTGGNLGYGRAANLGVAELGPDVDFVLLSNPDVVLRPGSIDELIEVALRHPTAGAVGPLILTEDGIVFPSARRVPSIGSGIGHALFGWWLPKNPWTRAYRDDRAEPVEREAGWLSGACLLFRRTAFEAVGGFDPSYFMYFEDVDLGDRLARHGFPNIYAPSAVVVHVGGVSAGKHPREMALAHHRSAYRYLSGRYDRWWQAPLRLVLKVGLWARAMLAARSAKVAGGAALPERKG